MRKVNLSNFLEEVTNFSNCLGPEEYAVLSEAGSLLQTRFPSDEATRVAYITASTRIQNNLINLLSRVSYIFVMKTYERDSYWGSLIEEKAYEGRDRKYIALNSDPVYRDLCEVTDTLELVKTMIDNFLWALRIVLQRLK